MLTLFILSYTLGAGVTYGAMFSYWQRSWLGMDTRNAYYRRDRKDAIAAAIAWPASIISALTVWGRRPFQSGLKFY